MKRISILVEGTIKIFILTNYKDNENNKESEEKI